MVLVYVEEDSMLLILEVTFFLLGLYLLIMGKLPQRVFGILFGRKEYAASASKARLLGLILIAPISFSVCFGFILGFVFGQDGVVFAGFGEMFLIVAVAVIAIFMVRSMRVAPEDVALETESENT